MTTRQSFPRRLSLSILLITSVLFILTIAITAISSHVLIAEEATKSAENLLDATIQKTEKTLENVETTVVNLAEKVYDHLDDKDGLYAITTYLISTHSNIIGASIAFRENFYPDCKYCAPYSYREPATGAIVEKELGSDRYDYFSMEWYSESVESGKGHWSEPYYDDGGADCIMATYSWPIKDSSGETFAVMTADIPLDWIANTLARIKPYPSSHVSMVSQTGRFINIEKGADLAQKNIFYGEQFIKNRKSRAKVHEIAERLIAGEKGMVRYANGRKQSFIVFGPLENGWNLSITCPYKEVLARSSAMHLILILIGLVGLGTLFILCYLTIRRLTRPLVEFADSAIKIANGNFNTSLPEIHYDDEIGRLRNSFVYMQHSLTSYIDNLKETTAAKQRIESELTIASKIQMAMLAKEFPENGHFSIHALLKPAKEVGGDFYDFVLRDNLLYFAVGDVSGKGVPASMFMAITRFAFRYITGMGIPLDQVVSNINNTICDGNRSNMFVTLFVGRLDLETGVFQYCNAGHNPIMLNGEFLKAEANIAIGVMSDFNYKMEQTLLSSGSTFLLYTDGVTEAERADKEQFGEKRLFDWMQNALQRNPQQICEGLFDEVRSFAEGNDQNDDITIMSIKLK